MTGGDASGLRHPGLSERLPLGADLETMPDGVVDASVEGPPASAGRPRAGVPPRFPRLTTLDSVHLPPYLTSEIDISVCSN